MVYIPPVQLPPAGQNDYSRQLYAFAAGPGETIGRLRQERTANDQWEQNYSAQLNRDEFNQMDSNRRFDLAQREFDAGLGPDGVRTSLVPQWGVDEQGNTVPLMARGDGTMVPYDLPDGVQALPGMQPINLGTSFGILNKKTGQVEGNIPIDVAGQKAAEAGGKAQGEAAANLPSVEVLNDRIVRTIDAVLADPYLSKMTGPIEGRLPNVSAAAHRVQANLDLILGGTFLTAYNDLRGGGQITEAEGQAAKEAYNTLQTMTMGDKDYEKALLNFRREVVALTEIAQRKAAGQTQTQVTPQDAEIAISRASQLGQIPPEVAQEAIEAIRQGAPPEAVLKRLTGQ